MQNAQGVSKGLVILHLLSWVVYGVWVFYYSCLKCKCYNFKCITNFISLNRRWEVRDSPETVLEWVVLNTNNLSGLQGHL